MLDGPSSRAPAERSWQSWRSSLDAIIRSVRSRPGRAAVASAAVASALLVGWWLFRAPAAPSPEAVLPLATTGAPSAPGAPTVPTVSEAPLTTVVVHVAGAVLRPGVLRLPTGARVVDAIDAAGGTTPDADPTRINLAALLADGAWIHVPRLGADSPPPPAGAGGASGTASGAPSAPGGGPLDLNTATADQLEDLPGIGPATAAAIIEHRTRNGPFASVDALTDVPGIGAAKLAQLQSLVRV